MNDEDRLLQPSEQITVFGEKVRDIMCAYCCLTAREADGRSSTRGTGVFLRRRGGQYLATVANRLFDESDPNFSAFGGYSGGPLVLLTPSKNHLIGFVKQGGRMFGEPRIFASSVFDVLRASGR